VSRNLPSRKVHYLRWGSFYSLQKSFYFLSISYYYNASNTFTAVEWKCLSEAAGRCINSYCPSEKCLPPSGERGLRVTKPVNEKICYTGKIAMKTPSWKCGVYPAVGNPGYNSLVTWVRGWSKRSIGLSLGCSRPLIHPSNHRLQHLIGQNGSSTWEYRPRKEEKPF
jgi:hypothetical protein